MESTATILRRDILAAIQTFRALKNKPPLTPAELVVAPLAVNDCDMDEFEIAKWIRGTFSWYAVDPMVGRRRIGLQDAFDDAKLPATEIESGHDGIRHAKWFATGNSETQFETMTEDFTIPFSIDSWIDYRRVDYTPSPRGMHPYGEKFGIFLANKQIFEEAMPIFYQQNVFYFYSVYQLSKFLPNLPVYRRQHLRTIAFSYYPSDANLAAWTFRDLSFLPRLQSIHIDIAEDRWMRDQSLDGYAMDPLQIRNLDALAKSIHGLKEAAFSQRCVMTADYLKAKLQESGKKKPKRTGVALTGRKSHARAAKSKKTQS